jgi:ATP-binding cassette subfamily B protein
MLVVALMGLLFGILGGVFGAKASAGFAKNLRKAMYDNIQTFSFASIDKFSTSSLVTRLTTDVTNIQNAYQMILRMAMRAPASLVVAMCMAFYINARIARVYLIAVILLGIVLALIINSATKIFR